MYQGKKKQFDWTFALAITDVIAVAATFVAAALVSHSDEGMAAPPNLTKIAYFGLILYILKNLKAYTWPVFTSPLRALTKVVETAAIATFSFAVFRFLFGDPRSESLTPWLLAHTLSLLVILFVFRLAAKFFMMDVFRIVPVERIAFVGWGNRVERVLSALAKQMGTFQQTLGFFHVGDKAQGNAAFAKGYAPLGSLETIETGLVENKITLLIMEEGSVTMPELQEIGDICARCFVDLKVIPNAFEIWASKVSLRMVAGIPLLGVYNLHYDRFHNRLAKRAMDIVASAFGLMMSLPIIGLMAILIKRESPGPVFFKQVRLGLNNKPFHIIKLRSMRLDAEKQTGAVWAVADDPRRLKIGEFMRKTNIDELPQFWNVLKGDMSMVGPRPERPEFVKDFKQSIRYYNLRHSCKPGVTGWAAVNGLRGNTSLEDRLDYDLFYIENWSLLLDIKIMLMTLAPPKNAY